MARAGFGEEGVNLRGARLGSVVLGKGAVSKKWSAILPSADQRSSRSAWIICAIVPGALPMPDARIRESPSGRRRRASG